LQIYNRDAFGYIDYIWITALVWTILFMKILISPELLYGYNLFVAIIQKENIEQLEIANVWTVNSKKEIYNAQDIILKKQFDIT